MQAIIFLNGKAPELRLINKYSGKKSCIISADGASNYLKRLGITPDVIIGDMDSINKSTLDFFKKKKIRIINIEEQETTDFEKSINFCLKNKFKTIKVFGAISTRSDHSLNNFSVLKKYHKKTDIKIIASEFEIFFIRNKIEFIYKLNEVVSLIALPKANGITTSGLLHPLKNQDLEFGKKDGTLNKSVSERVIISFKSGNLLLFKKHFN